MRQEFNLIEGDLEITDDVALFGICHGDIVVKPAAHLQLKGVCTGDIEVEEHAVVEISGIVQGKLRNRGGEVDVHGVIQGSLLANAGRTTVHRDAMVQVDS
jgi:hypothetical protein